MNRATDDPPVSVTIRPLTLERGTPPGGRFGAGLVFLGGFALLGGCGWLLFDAWRSSNPNSVFGLVLGLLLGLGAIYRQWRPVMLICRTAVPHGEIAPREVATGGEFSFRYRQEVRRPFQADVTTSLVLRETITIKSEDSPDTQVKRDHLVSAHTEKALRIGAGGFLQIQCTFRLPDDMRNFPVNNWPARCVVKVHVQVQRGADFWEEFSLPLPVSMTAAAGSGEVQDAGYQVTLVSFPNLCRDLLPPPPVDEYLPHLATVDRLPLVLLRGITRAEAETACRRLEAAGGVVELSQGGRVIARRRVHNLPLPAETVGPKPAGLPLPASETAGSLQPRTTAARQRKRGARSNSEAVAP